jgi:DNA-binding transcriptional LysR family regulator
MSHASKLGVRLFHRTTQGVSLTETGEQLVSAVAPALGQIREAMGARGK